MLELENALERILSRLPSPTGERVALPQAAGRIIAEDIHASLPLPPFDNSSMDGYAVRTADVASASENCPVPLRLAGRIEAGQAPGVSVNAGECIRVFTGSPMPAGADAVVMQEDTRAPSGDPHSIEVLDGVRPWENVRFRGEDVKLGSLLAGTGEPLGAAKMALLAAVGIADVTVAKRPVISLLATGNELRQAGETLQPGQIHESNRFALRPLLERAGAVIDRSEIVRDDFDATRSAIERAFQASDFVITCGGVSVGEMDFVKDAFERIGGELNFWRVAIKPGRPFVFGQLGSKFLFGLPGNPVSAFVTFLLLARPAIRQWQGATDVSLAKRHGRLAEPISNSGERRHFVRVRMDSQGVVHSAGLQASHALSSLANANGLLDVPGKTNFAAGAEVAVLQWD